MSVAENLRNASELLTEETWCKGSYFAARNGKVCMCAHGAIQAVINPAVREALYRTHEAEPEAIAGAAAEAIAGAAARAASVEAAWHVVLAAAEAGRTRSSPGNAGVWDRRPEWCIPEHYICGMVGLTVDYNDATSTTLADVKAKLEAAAKLAEELGA